MFQEKEETDDVTLFCNISHWYATTSVTTVHSRRQESHRKQNALDISFALRMKSCSDHVMCVCIPLQGCPESECRLTCDRMQWVHWTNCALCPLLAVSCGDAGLDLFTLSLSSPRMDYRLYSNSSLTAFWDVIARSPEYTVSYPKRLSSSYNRWAEINFSQGSGCFKEIRPGSPPTLYIYIKVKVKLSPSLTN
jgi:hypothetical protein